LLVVIFKAPLLLAAWDERVRTIELRNVECAEDVLYARDNNWSCASDFLAPQFSPHFTAFIWQILAQIQPQQSQRKMSM
jgi:hypothetical protein